jgi:hypothetical protein
MFSVIFILLDTLYRHISTVEITKGSINESLAHPRDLARYWTIGLCFRARAHPYWLARSVNSVLF